MKYKVTTTTADRVNGHEYNSARAALTAYNNIRKIYTRAGYTIADAGTGHNSRAELWTKEGRADRNIEIWPVTDEDTTTAAPAAGSMVAKVATAARVFLLVCCLSAADGLTAAAPAADSIETDTPADVCELLTADPLAQVAEFAAAGLTVSHVTIKSTTPAAC